MDVVAEFALRWALQQPQGAATLNTLRVQVSPPFRAWPMRPWPIAWLLLNGGRGQLLVGQGAALPEKV
jgi:hypothetical protein